MAINYFKEDILNSVRGTKDNIVQYFDNGILPYLDSMQRKFGFIKTFIHRQTKVEFYSLYFPIDLTIGGNVNVSVKSINELFFHSNCVTIIGNAGSGKSMLVKHVFLNAIEEKYRIPVMIELRRLNDLDTPLIEYIENVFVENEIVRNTKIFKQLLKSGKFVFLFDGYDEIYSSYKDEFNKELEAFIDVYNLNYFLITSRPGAFIDLLPRFTNMKIRDLSKSQVKKFVDLQIKVWGKNQEFSDRISDVIFSDRNSDYIDYLKNPLLLSMYILGFENNPQIPKKKSTFYGNVFHTLCTRHDSVSKQGWLHEKRTNLSIDEIEVVLETFSFITFFQGQYEFLREEMFDVLNDIKPKLNINYDSNVLIEDLEVALSILLKDGNEYKFPHRSMQEYFAMKFIKDKPDDIKKHIYGGKLPDLEKKSFDSHFNFWSLCEENDKFQFLNFFLVPQMRKYLPPREKREDKIKVMKGIFKDINLRLNFILDDKGLYVSENWNGVMNDWIVYLFYVDEIILPSNKLTSVINSELLEKYSSESKKTSHRRSKNKDGKIESYSLSFEIISQNPTDFGLSSDKITSFLVESYNEFNDLINKIELRLAEGEKSNTSLLDMI